MLKFILYNILVANFFDYLLLIMFDNEYVTKKSNLNLVLSKKYEMIYYFLIVRVI